MRTAGERPRHVLVTGGAGYKGAVLVPLLLERGYRVTVLDALWFGNSLVPHARLAVVEGDVRSVGASLLDGVDAVLHLANVANDPCAELDPKLTWEVNALGTQRLADLAVRARVSQFVFASSGSVYGVTDAPRVTEELPLVPLSDYNKSKMVAERAVLSYRDALRVQVVRPATVCGPSPRMRLDVSVNMLTVQALEDGRITVFGGGQVRPNLHVEDAARVYLHLLEHPELGGVFNAGFENVSILDLARRIAARVPAEIAVSPSNDPRSYRLDSAKLLATGFRPIKGVDDAIDEIAAAHRRGVRWDRERGSNVAWMRKRKVA